MKKHKFTVTEARLLVWIYYSGILFLLIGMILAIVSIPLLLALYLIWGVTEGFKKFYKEFPEVIGLTLMKTIATQLDKRSKKLKEIKNQ